MDKNINKKLLIISEVWNQYIPNYRFCNDRIKFTPDVQSNYFADILRYFFDSLEIINLNTETKTFTEHFERTISFLQAVYIQQDFIEELLHIFKCNINKGHLKQDLNYSINRKIRNELIGHPISRNPDSKQFVSSTIFSNSTSSDNIEYIRYHIDNCYKFEKLKYSKKEIIQRHLDFLNFYLDKIILRQRTILTQFCKKLDVILKVINLNNFEDILTISSHSFEFFSKTNYLYKKDSLLEIYNSKRLLHERYEYVLTLFLEELKDSITETKEEIQQLIDKINSINLPNIDIEILFEGIYEEDTLVIQDITKKTEDDRRFQYNSLQYAMSKISDKDFGFSTIIEDTFPEDKSIFIEIENMRNNMENDLEYYCSYYYLGNLLQQKSVKL
jgi:hypothetical protein